MYGLMPILSRAIQGDLQQNEQHGQILPLSAITSATERCLKHFAYYTYSRIKFTIQIPNRQARHPEAKQSHALFQSLPFVVARSKAPRPSFPLTNPQPSVLPLEEDSMLHISYDFTEDQKWLHVAAIDEGTEPGVWQTAPTVEPFIVSREIIRVLFFADAFRRSKSISRRIVICRASHMPSNEAQGTPNAHLTVQPLRVYSHHTDTPKSVKCSVFSEHRRHPVPCKSVATTTRS